MANYKLQEMNDLRNTGKRTVYPKVVTNRTMDTNDIVEKMKGYNLGIAPSTTKAVLENISNILVTMLSMGYNVKLDGIGIFSSPSVLKITSPRNWRTMPTRCPIGRWA